jgi:hypothetical protein
MIIAPPHVCSLANCIPDFDESLRNDQGHHKMCAQRSRTRWAIHRRRHGQRAHLLQPQAQKGARSFCSQLIQGFMFMYMRMYMCM